MIQFVSYMVHEANRQHLSEHTEGTIVNKETSIKHGRLSCCCLGHDLKMSTDRGDIFIEISMTAWRNSREG